MYIYSYVHASVTSLMKSTTCLHGLMSLQLLEYIGCYTHESSTYMCNVVYKQYHSYGTNHPQLKLVYAYHTRMGFLDSIRMYTRTEYLHTHMFLHVYMLLWLM